MFWDNVAGVYDIFVKVINRRTHNELKGIVGKYIEPHDKVLECAAGTGMLSAVIAERCDMLVATDFAPKMIKHAEKNCSAYDNITFELADIMALEYPDNSFDKVVAGNVIHLLDEPLKALAELNRVCKPDGMLIIPTYMNRDKSNKEKSFANAVGKAGADFKRQFNVDSYLEFFQDAGYSEVNIELAYGRIPCAVAMMRKKMK
ncbi:SAM-dependent methyltransferase [Mogibacterium pumilum]|uniref:SAM-dependent methyltransferase n=2 Tax=Mogibacterium pumilum TaxID=86332 RepID=A0A223ASI8_9FIRM|nr:SAM-dependent methyltransferase [Mogibacterium pumilum]